MSHNPDEFEPEVIFLLCSLENETDREKKVERSRDEMKVELYQHTLQKTTDLANVCTLVCYQCMASVSELRG